MGTKKHGYAEKLHERFNQLYGGREHLLAEKRFKDGARYTKGQGVKGTVKPDIYNTKTGDAYDFKFGNARLSSAQKARNATNLPRKADGSEAKTFKVKPNRGREK